MTRQLEYSEYAHQSYDTQYGELLGHVGHTHKVGQYGEEVDYVAHVLDKAEFVGRGVEAEY